MATVAVLSWSLNLSKPPNEHFRASHNCVLGSDEQGDRFFQKIEWFKCPPPLNFNAGPTATAPLEQYMKTNILSVVQVITHVENFNVMI